MDMLSLQIRRITIPAEVTTPASPTIICLKHTEIMESLTPSEDKVPMDLIRDPTATLNPSTNLALQICPASPRNVPHLTAASDSACPVASNVHTSKENLQDSVQRRVPGSQPAPAVSRRPSVEVIQRDRGWSTSSLQTTQTPQTSSRTVQSLSWSSPKSVKLDWIF